MTEDPATTVRDGAIFWRGRFQEAAFAERLAAHFESVDAPAWWVPHCREHARALRAALAETQAGANS
jgi:hypothetical protein